LLERVRASSARSAISIYQTVEIRANEVHSKWSPFDALLAKEEGYS
jgi:hypothetical protein